MDLFSSDIPCGLSISGNSLDSIVIIAVGPAPKEEFSALTRGLSLL